MEFRLCYRGDEEVVDEMLALGEDALRHVSRDGGQEQRGTNN